MVLSISNQHPYFSIERLVKASALPSEFVRDEVIEIYLVTSGEVIIDGLKSGVHIPENSLYCISWKPDHRLKIKHGTDGYLVRLNHALIYSGDKDFASIYFPAFQVLTLQKEVIRLDEAYLAESKKMCSMMLQEFEKENDFKLRILSGYINIFLFHLMRKLNLLTCNMGDERRLALIRKFNFLLEKNFRTNRKVSEYAALLSVTPNYLNAAIKQTTGTSASAHIRRRVVVEAVRKASLTGASLKEVAYDLGFSDHAHFSKFFKKGSGTNFSELKKFNINNPVVS